ncbi:MAG: PAS domain S-box protein [Thermoplasmata archaeon]|nr:PAS domain S-box protein [Thermoplasmata archaeon]
MVEYHLGHAMEVANDWLMVLEGRRVIYSNRGLLEALQTPSESVIGHELVDIFPSRVCGSLDELLEEMHRREGRLVTGSLECDDAMLGSTALAVRGETRGGYTYLSINRPMMDAEGSKDRLMEVEDRLSALLGLAASAGIGLGVFEVLPDGTFLAKSFNEHIIEIFNRPEKELLSVSPVEYVHPDDRHIAQGAIDSMMESGTPSGPIHIRIIDGEGEIVHVQIINSMLSPPNERLGITFVQDMTTVKEALDQQNRMVQAIERVDETVILADAKGLIFYANPAALRNSGYSLEEVVGQHMTMFSSPEGVDTMTKEALAELLNRGWWRGDVMAITKDGVRYPVEVSGSIVKDSHGMPSMFVIISRKILERQRFEAQLIMTKGNHERLRDLLEWELFPKMQRSIERLEALVEIGGTENDPDALPRVVEEATQVLSSARHMVQGLPSPERAEELRPLDLDTALRDRLPGMVGRYRHEGKTITMDLRPSEQAITVSANDMLPDMIMRLFDVLVRMASMEGHAFTVSMATIGGAEIPGTRTGDWAEGEEPVFASISITAPGLVVGSDLRSLLVRQELRSRGPLPIDEHFAIETSRLLVFLFNCHIYVEHDEAQRRDRLVIIMPLAPEA